MVDPEAVSRAGVVEALDLEVLATTMAAHSTMIKAAANAELPRPALALIIVCCRAACTRIGSSRPDASLVR